MSHPFNRSAILIGQEGLALLAEKHVLIAGVGGVGGHAAEVVARGGVGRITLVDADTVDITNLNRQLVALHSTVGSAKVQVMAARIADINPGCRLTAHQRFLHKDAMAEFLATEAFDFVVDCIDSMPSKVALAVACVHREVPLISSMGAGGRTDPGKVKIDALNKTQVCPLAREMRSALRKEGVEPEYPVVYSDEKPKPPALREAADLSRTFPVQGTISYLPALFGVMAGGEALRRLLLELA